MLKIALNAELLLALALGLSAIGLRHLPGLLRTVLHAAIRSLARSFAIGGGER